VHGKPYGKFEFFWGLYIYSLLGCTLTTNADLVAVCTVVHVTPSVTTNADLVAVCMAAVSVVHVTPSGLQRSLNDT
jgi:hypothetical protein